jgi:tetratricopeptide (TPR) repeat protein
MAAVRVQLAAAVPGAAVPQRTNYTMAVLLVLLALAGSVWIGLEIRKSRADAAGSVDAKAGLREEYHRNYDRADALFNAADWKGLAAYAQAWSVEHPASFEAWTFLAIAKNELRDWPGAVAADRRALALMPGDRETRLHLADNLVHADGGFREAETLYEQLYIENDSDTHVLNNYAVLLGKNNQRARAIVLLERAVRLDPGFKLAWGNLAEQYRISGDAGKAADALARSR